MDETTMKAIAQKLIGAWNAQDVERLVACYTDDIAYVDPNTRGAVEGKDANRRYLAKLFGKWNMTWALKQAYIFEDGSGCAAMWHATFQKPEGGETVEADGMDLVIVEGELVKRNEVYFDRALLATLI